MSQDQLQEQLQDQATRLLYAAEHGDNTTMTELLQSTSPDVQNSSHFTPFILAAYSGSIINLRVLE